MSDLRERKSPVPLAGETGLGEQLGRSAHWIDTTLDDRPQGLSIADHEAAQESLRAACVCLHLCAGKTPQEVAAAVAARAIAALRSKRQPEGQARP